MTFHETAVSFAGGAATASAFIYLWTKKEKIRFGLGKRKQELGYLVQRLQMEMRDISERMKIDYCALAFYDPVNMEIRWRMAHGALSSRYLSIVVRVGRGIAGRVLQTRRPMVIHDFPTDVSGDPLEYPILFVEKLRSTATFPLSRKNEAFGVFLVGQRTKRLFSKEELQILEQIADSLSNVFYEYTTQIHSKNTEYTAISSPLVCYLLQKRQEKPQQMHLELLDQQVAQISGKLQVQLVGVFDEIFATLWRSPSDLVEICIERKSEQHMAMEIKVNRKIEHPEQTFPDLLEKISKMKGSVEMYNEPFQFKLVMNFTVGLLFTDPTWIR